MMRPGYDGPGDRTATCRPRSDPSVTPGSAWHVPQVPGRPSRFDRPVQEKGSGRPSSAEPADAQHDPDPPPHGPGRTAETGRRRARPQTSRSIAVQAAMNVIVVVTSLVLGGVAALTLSWMLYAWRSPDGLAATRFSRGEPTTTRTLRFSLLVPARHEDQVLGHTLDGLAALDHPDVEILCIVGHDDDATAAVAALGRRAPPRARARGRRPLVAQEQAQGAQHGAAALHGRRGRASSTPRTRCTRTAARHRDHVPRGPAPTWCRAACS